MISVLVACLVGLAVPSPVSRVPVGVEDTEVGQGQRSQPPRDFVAEVFTLYQSGEFDRAVEALVAAFSTGYTEASVVAGEVRRAVGRGPREAAAVFALDAAHAWATRRTTSPFYTAQPYFDILNAGAARARQRRDDFEQAWYRTAVAHVVGPAVQTTGGGEMPSRSLSTGIREFLRLARARLPDDGRVGMAVGIGYELYYRRSAQTESEPATLRQQLNWAQEAYLRAAKDPDTASVAALRLGDLRRLEGKPAEAEAVWTSLLTGKPAGDTRYLAHVFRGQLLAQQPHRRAEAIGDLREALRLVPGAQSPTITLVALLRLEGSREEAEALVAGLFNNRPANSDPLLTYLVPGYPDFAAGLQELRQVLK